MKQNILQELRISRGVSREDLAKATGLTIEQIDAVEGGKEMLVNTRTIVKVSEFFKLQPSEIFFG